LRVFAQPRAELSRKIADRERLLTDAEPSVEASSSMTASRRGANSNWHATRAWRAPRPSGCARRHRPGCHARARPDEFADAAVLRQAGADVALRVDAALAVLLVKYFSLKDRPPDRGIQDETAPYQKHEVSDGEKPCVRQQWASPPSVSPQRLLRPPRRRPNA
jgi:hypothetical protein